jgi:hypothetical protein
MSMFVPSPARPARNGWRSKNGGRGRRDGNAAVIAAGVQSVGGRSRLCVRLAK